MKNLKKFAVTGLATLMLASMTVPAFAATTRNCTYAASRNGSCHNGQGHRNGQGHNRQNHQNESCEYENCTYR